jgi:hypothetical protein
MPEIGCLLGWRDRAPGEVDLIVRQSRLRRRVDAQVLREQASSGVAEPIGDTECAELGEGAVVEDQDEMADAR